MTLSECNCGKDDLVTSWDWKDSGVIYQIMCLNCGKFVEGGTPEAVTIAWNSRIRKEREEAANMTVTRFNLQFKFQEKIKCCAVCDHYRPIDSYKGICRKQEDFCSSAAPENYSIMPCSVCDLFEYDGRILRKWGIKERGSD